MLDLNSRRRFIMSSANNELKYAECNFCGQEKKCFVQYHFGEEEVVCPDCLSIADLADFD